MTKLTDDQELLALYTVEAAEHLGTLNESLLRLETMQGDAKVQDRRQLLEALSRAAHSLKGASRAVGMAPVEKISHRMESIFDAIQAGRLEIGPAIADVLYDALDAMQDVLNDPDTADIEAVLTALSEVVPAPTSQAADPILIEKTDHQIERSGGALAVVEPPTSGGPMPIRPVEESIRVTVAKLDELMADASDLLIARSSIEQRLTDVDVMRKANHKWQKEWRKVRTQYIRAVRQSTTQGVGTEWGGLLEFLNLTQRYMRISTQQLLNLDRALTADSLRLNLIAESLQDGIRRVRLVPFETQIGLFQRIVRDVAREVGKEVSLQVSGAAIELDKRVLEAIKDPIIHILRNAVDHGIESPVDRKRRGKPTEGMIILALSQRGGNVMVLVADDGRGIDVSSVRRAARRILSEAELEVMSDADALSLVMLPGLSTSPQVTSISGRGVGLDVVRQNIEALQGRITIESALDVGTTFRLIMPVSLSTLRCMLARIGDELYAIPTTTIEQIISTESINPSARFTAGGRPMITVNDRVVGVVSLGDVLERPAGSQSRYAIVLASGDRRMAFMVDDLITEQEMVVKNLNLELSKVRHVSGATLLGSGEVVIILNVGDLIKTAQSQIAMRPAVERQSGPSPLVAKPLLIVDDSITTRTLEKNILEAAGFDVITATNGLEALDVLDRTPCALMVADVEMPYMNGFDLTAKVRHSDRFSQLPVILVTSLDTQEHKERGFNAGADAYIIKGSFNQGELLQTVRQLLGQTRG